MVQFDVQSGWNPANKSLFSPFSDKRRQGERGGEERSFNIRAYQNKFARGGGGGEREAGGFALV